MNLKNLGTSLAVLSLSLTSACVYSEPVGGDVTFLWRFDGASCDRDRRVESVRIIIPGESFPNRGFFPCSSNGVDGIKLEGFYPGYYDYRLEAVDYDGLVSYTASGTFEVDGSITLSVDLYPTY